MKCNRCQEVIDNFDEAFFFNDKWLCKICKDLPQIKGRRMGRFPCEWCKKDMINPKSLQKYHDECKDDASRFNIEDNRKITDQEARIAWRGL